MKRIGYILLVSFIFYGCSSESHRLKDLEINPYFVSNISWDTNQMESFGSGQIYYFAPNFQIKIFSNSFSHILDSLSWGEPGIILKIGNWKIKDDKIICDYKTTFRTFKVEPTEIYRVDTFYFFDKSIRNRTDTLTSNVLMTKELNKFFKQDWSKIE